MDGRNWNLIERFEKQLTYDFNEGLSRHVGHGDSGKTETRENELPEYRNEAEFATPKEEVKVFGPSHVEITGLKSSPNSSGPWQDNHNPFDTSLFPEITCWRNQESDQVRQPWGEVRKNRSDEDILGINDSDVVDSDSKLITNPVPIIPNIPPSPSRKKELFDDSDDDDYSDDIEGWKKKPISLWNESDTTKWLCEASSAIGKLYREISPKLAMPGEDLLLLTREDWFLYDINFGEQLYDSLCELRHRLDGSRIYTLATEVPDIDKNPEDETLYDSGSPSTGEDSDKEPPEPTKKTVRNPSKNKKQKKSIPLVYLFVLDLLHSPEYCPGIITWQNYEEKIFKFTNTPRVAELWSRFGNNKYKKYKKPMDHDTFTRAMRHHYRTGKKNAEGAILFLPHKESGVYELGPDAVGWRTEDRDFGRYHEFQSTIKKHKLVLSRGSVN